MKVISIHSKWKNLFDMVIITLTTYSCMKVVFQLEFNSQVLTMDPFDISIEVLFVFYIISNFFHCYKDKSSGKIIKNSKKIALNYLKGWFIIDVISSIPYELFFDIKYLYLKYLRLIRLIRLKKIFDFFQFWSNVTLKFRGMVKYIRMACIIICGTFISTCLWYLIVIYDKSDLNFYKINDMKSLDAWTQFVICFYFTLTTLTTTGFGDFYPKSVSEKGIIIVFMFIGVAFFTYLMSFLYEEISVTDDETFQIHNFINELSKYNICKQGSNFDKETQKNLTKNILFTSYNARYSKYDTKNILGVLPTQYKLLLTDYLWSDLFAQFCNHFYLEFKKQKFFYKLSFLFRYKRFNQGDIIYEKSIQVTEFYMIQKGFVEVDSKSSKIKNRMQEGDIIGDFYLLYDIKPIYVYKALSDVEVVAIQKDDFLAALKKDEKLYNLIKENCVFQYKATVVHMLEQNSGKAFDWIGMNQSEDIVKRKFDLDNEAKNNLHLLHKITNEDFVTGIEPIYIDSFKLEEKINLMANNKEISI